MISMIVATDRNGLIGKDNDMPWRLPEDLSYFKKITTGSTVVMGRNTFESIGKPLPNRENIILTRNSDYRVEGCRTISSIEALKGMAEKEEEIFVIGGANIYKQALPFTETLYLTYIDEVFEGDTYFPEIDENDWKMVSEEKGVKNEKNPYDYFFRVYKRRH